MRDPRGRYRDTKAIEEIIPAWAAGCAKCTCGIVASPPLTGATNVYLERLVQMIDKQLTLCDCKAGVRYYSNLRNRYRILFEEAKRKPPPDIEVARLHIERAMAMTTSVPTIHFDERIAA